MPVWLECRSDDSDKELWHAHLFLLEFRHLQPIANLPPPSCTQQGGLPQNTAHNWTACDRHRAAQVHQWPAQSASKDRQGLCSSYDSKPRARLRLDGLCSGGMLKAQIGHMPFLPKTSVLWRCTVPIYSCNIAKVCPTQLVQAISTCCRVREML